MNPKQDFQKVIHKQLCLGLTVECWRQKEVYKSKQTEKTIYLQRVRQLHLEQTSHHWNGNQKTMEWYIPSTERK